MKQSIFAGLSGLISLFEFKAPKSLGPFPYPHVKEGQTMLWPAEKGTYRRAKHGPLKDENGNPRYA